jgi:hypothetical protein
LKEITCGKEEALTAVKIDPIAPLTKIGAPDFASENSTPVTIAVTGWEKEVGMRTVTLAEERVPSASVVREEERMSLVNSRVKVVFAVILFI